MKVGVVLSGGRCRGACAVRSVERLRLLTAPMLTDGAEDMGHSSQHGRQSSVSEKQKIGWELPHTPCLGEQHLFYAPGT